MSRQSTQGLMITRTINRVIVIEKPPQPKKNSGCWETGCGCLMLVALLLGVLAGINACTDGQLLATPVATWSQITVDDD